MVRQSSLMSAEEQEEKGYGEHLLYQRQRGLFAQENGNTRDCTMAGESQETSTREFFDENSPSTKDRAAGDASDVPALTIGNSTLAAGLKTRGKGKKAQESLPLHHGPRGQRLHLDSITRDTSGWIPSQLMVWQK